MQLTIIVPGGTSALPYPDRYIRLRQFLVIASTAFLTVVDLFAAQAILPSLTRHYAVMPTAMAIAGPMRKDEERLALAAYFATFTAIDERVERRLFSLRDMV